MFHIDPTVSHMLSYITHLCFSVFYCALSCFHHRVLHTGVLIYSAPQLQDCIIKLLTYLISCMKCLETTSAMNMNEQLLKSSWTQWVIVTETCSVCVAVTFVLGVTGAVSDTVIPASQTMSLRDVWVHHHQTVTQRRQRPTWHNTQLPAYSNCFSILNYLTIKQSDTQSFSVPHIANTSLEGSTAWHWWDTGYKR